MVRQVLSKVFSNGYKVVSETVRGKFTGNPKEEIQTIISVFDELGNLIVKRDKQVLKNMSGDALDHFSRKIPEDYKGATLLISRTTFPTNNILGEVAINKEITNYSGLFQKIRGSVEYPNLGSHHAGRSSHVTESLQESFGPTVQEFYREISARANGTKFDTGHYPKFLKEMIVDYAKKI